MKFVRFLLVALLFVASPACAQWQTQNHSVPIGKGGSNIGFSFATPGTAGQPLVSNGPSADPSFQDLNFLAAGTGAQLRTLQSKLRDVVSIYDFGLVCDGTTLEGAKFQAALTAAAGKTLYIPFGNCKVDTTQNLASNNFIEGSGPDNATITGTASPMFLGTNVSNISIRKLTIQGTDNVTSWASGTAGAIQIMQNSSAVAAGRNYDISNNRFRNFNNAYWVYFGTQTSTQSIYNVNITGNHITTTSGDVPNDANPLNDSNYGFVFFGGTGGGGQYVNTRITDNKIEAGALCFPIIMFPNHTRTIISRNQISDNGRTTPAHCVNGFGTSWNTYGISIYDLNGDNNPGTQWEISDNVITNPYASGVYVVGDAANPSDCKGCLISSNTVYGQGQQDSNPRGGIVVASTTNVNVIGNTLMEGYGGIVVSGQTVGTVLVEGNNCRSAVPYVSGSLRPSCLNLAASGVASPTSKVLVYGNNFENTGTTSSTVLSSSSSGSKYGKLDIAGNSISGTGFNTMDLSGSFSVNGISVRNNDITGSINYSSITGGITLSGNTGTALTVSTLPAATNGSSAFVSDGTAASSPCTGSGTGSTAFRQNSAWKCF